MLSWELPPIFTGGLGVACEGIATELSKHVNLSVVVPKYSDKSDFSFDVIGLSSIEEKTERVITHDFFTNVVRLPYLNLRAHVNKKRVGKETVLSKGELYENIEEKVNTYTQLVVEIAIQKDIDVIYAHDWLTFLAGIELKKRKKKPLVVHIHSLEFDRSGADATSKGITYDIEKSAMQFADEVIVVSEYTAKVCEYHYGISPDKIKVVYNGLLDTKQKEKISYQKKRKEVVFLGRLTEQKGPVYFLKMAKELLKINKDVQFTVAGSGEELGGLSQEEAKNDLDGRIRFVGQLDREGVNKLFLLADVYCMPSVSEPFGLSALEAAYNGVPVVLSKHSGVSEVLSGAITLDYWSSKKMAAEINDLLLNSDVYDNKVKLLSADIEKLTWTNSVLGIRTVFNALT